MKRQLHIVATLRSTTERHLFEEFTLMLAKMCRHGELPELTTPVLKRRFRGGLVLYQEHGTKRTGVLEGTIQSRTGPSKWISPQRHSTTGPPSTVDVFPSVSHIPPGSLHCPFPPFRFPIAVQLSISIRLVTPLRSFLNFAFLRSIY